MSPARKRLTLVLLASVLCLLSAEVLLRVFDYPPELYYPWKHDPEIGYRYAPNLEQRMAHPEFDVTFQTNSRGYRDSGEIGPKSGFRIVLLGDSFTAGYGVALSDVFAERLEQSLGVEVVNLAVSGHELVHHLHYLRTSELRQLEPDLVVHMIFLGNDLSQNEAWVEGPGNSLRHGTTPFPEHSPGGLKLAQLWNVARFNRRLQEATVGEPWQPGTHELSLCTRAQNPLGVSHYQNAFRLLAEIDKEVGDTPYLPVMFGFVQMVDEQAAQALGEEYDFSVPERTLSAFFERRGQELVNLNPILRREQAREPLYYLSDVHWNPAGHKVVAEALTEAVRRRLPPGPGD